MKNSFALYVRGAFALFLLGMGLYAGLDRLADQALASRGLSTCGQADNPCALAPLYVNGAAAGRSFASDPAPAAHAAPMVMRAADTAPRAPHAAAAES